MLANYTECITRYDICFFVFNTTLHCTAYDKQLYSLYSALLYPITRYVMLRYADAYRNWMELKETYPLLCQPIQNHFCDQPLYVSVLLSFCLCAPLSTLLCDVLSLRQPIYLSDVDILIRLFI